MKTIFMATREREILEYSRLVLSRLKENQLYVSPKRSTFTNEEAEFLGLVVGCGGHPGHPHRQDIICHWPRLTNLTDLRSFLVLIQVWRRFIHQGHCLDVYF